MDFEFTPEEEAFRQEIRGFLKEELPTDWVVGDEGVETDEGWAFYYAAESRRTLELVTEYAREARADGEPLVRKPLVRHKLADLFVEAEVSCLLCYRAAWMQSKGLMPDHEPSMSRCFGTGLLQRVARTGMGVLGLSSQFLEGSQWAKVQGRIARVCLYSLGRTIAGGTSEIQRNIIATRGLGLPR